MIEPTAAQLALLAPMTLFLGVLIGIRMTSA
jgi:hypothetical protein